MEDSQHFEKTEKQRLFIFDDDEKILVLLNTVLKKHFEVTPITELSKLLIQAEIDRPHLILLDINMPNIDGFEVLRIVKSHPATLNTPVICMSADSSNDTRIRIRKAGAAGYIKKPFHMKTLFDDIEAIVRSLNKVVRSRDRKKEFTITFNEKEKDRLIHEQIERESKKEETIVLLSWYEAQDFLNTKELEMVEQGKLIFLQIKPSLLVKFPYIQDVSPVFHDINGLLDNPDYPTHIIFDEIRNIVNVYDPERALAKSYTLAAFFKTSYKRASFFSTKPSSQSNALLLEKMARVFVGNEN